MEDRVTTYKIEDLLEIFDPAVQEIDDTGGARIIYTFDSSSQPIRERVGETFILDVENPTVSFFVFSSVDDFIGNGYIVPAVSLSGVDDRYQLSVEDLKELIKDVSLSLGYGGEEEASSLLE